MPEFVVRCADGHVSEDGVPWKRVEDADRAVREWNRDCDCGGPHEVLVLDQHTGVWEPLDGDRGPVPAVMPVERVRSLVALLFPDHMTPLARRQILAVCDTYERQEPDVPMSQSPGHEKGASS